MRQVDRRLRGVIELTAERLQSSRVFNRALWKNGGHLSTFTIVSLFSPPVQRGWWQEFKPGFRHLYCGCNLSPGYSPILPFVIPRNVDEPPKMPPKEILRRLTVAGKRSLHHVTTFISSFQKMRTARLKCTEGFGLVLLSRNEGERVNRKRF